MQMVSKILIIDDSEGLHQIYKVTLRRYKCEIITAVRREEGLKKLAENPGVNLILVDMNMPLSRMTALEFLQKVKQHEEFCNIPVITITTRGKHYSEEALVLSDGNLVKPFTSNEVQSLVEKLLQQPVRVHEESKSPIRSSTFQASCDR